MVSAMLRQFLVTLQTDFFQQKFQIFSKKYFFMSFNFVLELLPSEYVPLNLKHG